MIKNWKKPLDTEQKIRVIFMDLSKAFETINHSLLLAKLKAYGFSDQALSFLQSYLCSRFQRSTINRAFSSMKFSLKDLFSKCDQVRSFLRIWSHLLKKSLMEKFIFVQR